MKKLRLWLILFLLAFADNALARQHPPTFYLFEDPTLKITADDALQLFERSSFKKQSTHYFNPGFTRSVYWLALQTDSITINDSMLLVIGQAQINDLQFYSIENGKTAKEFTTGDLHPFDQRPVATTLFTFPVSGKKHLFLVRIDKHNEALQLSFHLRSTSEQIAYESRDSFITGSLSGVILLLLIFGIYLSAITRQRIYIFYVVYVISGWLWVLSDLGYAFQYFWPDLPWFGNRSRPVFSGVTIILSMQYLRYYIGGVKSKLLRIGLNVTTIFTAALLVLWLTPLEISDAPALVWLLLQLIPTVTAVYVILGLMILSAEVKRKNRMALFYLTALIPLMILVSINLLNHSGVINITGTLLEKYGVPMGYVSEVIILTFGLVYRFNSYKLDKERLQLTIERQQTENAKALIDTEAKERQRIADELHDISGSMISAARLNINSVRENNFSSDPNATLKLEKAEEALAAVAITVRNLSHALSPVMLQKLGIKRSVENIVSFFNSANKIKIEALVMGFEKYDERLERLYTVFYSIIYELLNNAVKHSGASDAIIQLMEHDDSVTLVVEDNGKGILKAFEKMESKGLSGIISKINYFNGVVEFDNTVNGLIISIEIPIHHYDKKSDPGG